MSSNYFPKISSKINEKSIKFDQESTRHRSWSVLGRLRAPYACGAHSNRASWRVLKASGAVLGGKARRLGSQENPKNFAKTGHDASKMAPRQPKIRFSAKNKGKINPSSSDGMYHPILVRFYLQNTSLDFENS